MSKSLGSLIPTGSTSERVNVKKIKSICLRFSLLTLPLLSKMGSKEGFGGGGDKRRVYKIVIMGGGGVGKSCLTFRLVHNQFLERYDPTIEDSYSKDNFKVDGEVCPIEILDTAGQDTFAAMRDLYYKSGDGFLLVYSITDSSSVEDVKDRYQGLIAATGDRCPPVTLVGNKCDLEASRVVSQAVGRHLEQEFNAHQVLAQVPPVHNKDSSSDNLPTSKGEDPYRGVTFQETSAKANINVEEVFQDMVRKIQKRDAQLLQQHQRKKPKKKASCLLC